MIVIYIHVSSCISTYSHGVTINQLAHKNPTLGFIPNLGHAGVLRPPY